MFIQNDSSENGEVYHPADEAYSTLDDNKPNKMTSTRNIIKVKTGGNIQSMKTETNVTLDESEIKEQKWDIPPEQELPPGYTRATAVIMNLKGN